MQTAHREQLAALASGLFHDWLLTLSEEQLKSELQRFNKASGGTLAAAHTIFTAKLELKNQNLNGEKTL